MTPDSVPAPRGEGRERVLQEAVRLFGEAGYAGTSVRAVAAAAGVSPANVMHHFGTKDALKEATDERVLGALSASLKGAAQAVLEGGDPVEIGTLVGDPGVRAYLRRVLLDGGPAGEALVADLVALVRAGLDQAAAGGHVRLGADLEYASVQVLALTVGPLLLGPLLPGFEAKTSPDEVAARAAADIATLREGLLR
ncbi:MAG: TetR family transcriptional regulator [Frankiales bacterium]|nr:TetR family transcriptional regulator [Frankiales bacterium]